MTSLVTVFCGGRGSGKTLSMSTQALIDMVAHGKKCWANYPIQFAFKPDEDSEATIYKSEKVDIEDLITFKDSIRDGVICLDELNLWASSRGSMSVVNRLLNSWIQLIRKRNLSLYIACQAFESLDRMLRWQTDITVRCMDLSFKYHNLKEGAYTSQLFIDWSGVFTGSPVIKWDNYEEIMRNSASRIFHGRAFWGIYDSWNEFDILAALTQYQIQRPVKVIGQIPSDKGNLAADLKAGLEPGTVIGKKELQGLFRQFGFTGGQDDFMRVIQEAGFKEVPGGFENVP